MTTLHAEPTNDGRKETVELPRAQSGRWQPIRGGLLNLYRFDYEEFRFEQGRLLLRGPNGTGKSRVLALQLPFLLDGEVSAHRVEPDGDQAKRIEWNLLLGKHSDRVGYTWVEFGRRDADGNEQYLTLGCGLSAVAGRGLTGKWFFITSQRVGVDLFLQTPSGHVLSKDRLREEIGSAGELFATATDYRKEIDAKLFKLGQHRYEALVNLLIQLRQPQLSRELDEKRLSAALSEALPPVSPSIIADVAEAFRSLESDRTALDAFKAASRGAEKFLAEYQVYAQIATRRRATAVRATHTAYETTMRRLRAAEAEQKTAEEALKTTVGRIRQLSLEEHAANVAVRTLEESPQMRDARALDGARRLAREREEDAQRAEEEHESIVATRVKLETERDQAAAAKEEVWERVRATGDQAETQAKSVELERDHLRAMELLALRDLNDLTLLSKAKELVEQSAAQRRRAMRHLEDLNQRIGRADAELGTAKQAHSDLTDQLDRAIEYQGEANDSLAEESESLINSYRAWVLRLKELIPADPDVITHSLTEWCETAEGKSPLELAIQTAVAESVRRLRDLRADLDQRLASMNADLDALRVQQERLFAGQHEPPPAPHTRDTDSRAIRPGAPLWALCDFASTVGESARAGVEAALEASGLLDAWVTPDGRLLDKAEHDTILVAGSCPFAPEGARLDQLLVPVRDRDDPRLSTVSDATVAAVLRHIGFGVNAGSVWVDSDGRWQVGPLHGTWAKPTAHHIGPAAREAHRQKRLESLAAEITTRERTATELQEQLASLEERERLAQRESGDAPSDGKVRDALAAIAAVTRQVNDLRARVIEADSRLVERRRRLTAATEERDAIARDLGLTEWVGDLRSLENVLNEYLTTIAGLWPTAREYVSLRRQAEAALQRTADALTEEQARSVRLQQAQTRALAAAVERDTLEQSVGAAVEEILARLEKAREDAEHILTSKTQAEREESDLKVNAAVAQERIEQQEKNLQRDAEQRDKVIAALRKFARTRLLQVAVSEISDTDSDQWSITRAVEVARTAESALQDVAYDDIAWERNQRGIHRHIQELNDALLPYDYKPDVTSDDDVLIVTVPYQGRTCTMTELLASLFDEVAQRQALLSAREREVLENHLVGEVATHLHERLHAAEELLRDMNAELKTRPTSSGLVLRFTWDPIDDGAPGLLEARRRLLGTSGTWSPAEREALGAFLQQQIQAVRAANDTGTWQEHLATALDYRTWHRFGVERLQDGQWKPLTKRTHGTGSGGEKAFMLTIPQLAAAAAHYESADPLAPRLILFDEAFVAIDTHGRSECMALIRAFDLDFVMTSEHEWGCYATLPGVAIYQLSARPGIDAVGVTRWVWNGQQRIRDDQPLPSPYRTVETLTSMASSGRNGDSDG